MSPEALDGDADVRFEGVVPMIVVVEIDGDAEERFEGIVPAVVTVEVG